MLSAAEFVSFAIGQGALRQGTFQTKGGRESPYFFDTGKFSDSDALDRLAQAYASAIRRAFVSTDGELLFDIIYGAPYKGTILVGPVVVCLHHHGIKKVPWCTSRKEPKHHGEGGLHIGAPIKKGARVLIIDDALSRGTAVRLADAYIRQYGGVIAGLVVAFDRQERGFGKRLARNEFEVAYKAPVHSIATLDDLVAFLKKRGRGRGSRWITRIEEYRAQWGVVKRKRT